MQKKEEKCTSLRIVYIGTSWFCSRAHYLPLSLFPDCVVVTVGRDRERNCITHICVVL